MDDQLDNDLKNRIKEVFDNYQDASADEGWLQLREKFPVARSNRRAAAWLWFGSTAALLLVFLGIGLWMFNTRVKPQNFAVKLIKHIPAQNIAINKTHPDSVNKVLVAGKNNPAKKEDYNLAKTTVNHAYQTGSATPKTLNSGIKNNRTLAPDLKYNASVNPQLDDTAVKRTFIAKNNTDSVKTNINKAIAPQLANNVQTQNATQPSVVLKPKPAAKSITDMFAADNNEKKPIAKETAKSKRVHFGIYEATYFNYSKGSNNQVNVGAGFTSDIRITKNLKLVTGVAIAQNSLSYSADNPSAASAVQSFAPVANNAAAMTNKYTALSTPSFKDYNASLVGLDIPVNLKYEFNPQKSDAYISAGVSSGTFINESYTYKYNYPSFPSPSLQQTQGTTSSTSFNNFYFAKTLNVAFGVGYPFGKNRLVIEPFLKYPLDGLGTQNIRFGAGGLNLKFNFQSPKK